MSGRDTGIARNGNQLAKLTVHIFHKVNGSCKRRAIERLLLLHLRLMMWGDDCAGCLPMLASMIHLWATVRGISFRIYLYIRTGQGSLVPLASRLGRREMLAY
jgi:hypothetical protein